LASKPAAVPLCMWRPGTRWGHGLCKGVSRRWLVPSSPP